MERTAEEIRSAMIEFFKENEDEFIETIESLDCYNGFLGDDRIYEMYMLDEFYAETSPLEILTRAFYGYDDLYTDENGRHTEEFNPNRDYFYYNGYGNLVSTDEKDYSWKLDEYFINEIIENAGNIDLPDEIQELIEELDELEEIA